MELSLTYKIVMQNIIEIPNYKVSLYLMKSSQNNKTWKYKTLVSRAHVDAEQNSKILRAVYSYTYLS